MIFYLVYQKLISSPEQHLPTKSSAKSKHGGRQQLDRGIWPRQNDFILKYWWRCPSNNGTNNKARRQTRFRRTLPALLFHDR